MMKHLISKLQSQYSISDDITSLQYSVDGYLVNEKYLIEPRLKMLVMISILGYHNQLIEFDVLQSRYLRFLETHMIFKVRRDSRRSKFGKSKVYKSKSFISRLLSQDITQSSLNNLGRKFNVGKISVLEYNQYVTSLLKIGEYHE